MFTILVLIIHIIVCIALILIILLQSGKGADIGAVFGGGGSQTVFGSTGATPFLSKVTIGAAIIFMVTSIVLTYFSGRVGSSISDKSIMSEQTTTEAPRTAPVPPAPGAGAETPKSEAPKAEGAQPTTAPSATPAPPGPAGEKSPEGK
jgi:preprotein translocase subunit SecG